MIPVKIHDGLGRGHDVRVSHAGELVTVRGNYDVPKTASMTSTATAYNIALPKNSYRFIITGIILNADKNVSATDGAVVEIYEANTSTSTTQLKNLFTLNIGKNTTVPITGILVQTTSGVYLNAETDDATVNITLLGYYLENDE